MPPAQPSPTRAELRAGARLATRLVAEAVATAIFFIVALGFALYAGSTGNGTLAVGFAFGFAALGCIIGVGHISGAHLNPAVTVGAWLAGRFPGRDVIPYIGAQLVGGLVAGGVLWYFASQSPEFASGSQAMAGISIGFGEHSPGGFALAPAIVAEVLGTALLIGIILAATARHANAAMAPLTIALTLAVLVMWIIPFTNGALNPARASATAVWAIADGSWPVVQLWAWWAAPLVGAAAAGLLYRRFGAPQHTPEIEILDVEDR